MDAAERAAFGHAPRRRAGAAVSLLGRVVDLHVGRAFGQVFAVMAQAVLGDLDGVEVALGAPLGGQRHAWEGRREAKYKITAASYCTDPFTLYYHLVYAEGLNNCL